MVKFAHECPIAIMKKVDEITDISYFLVHLFEENPAYLQLALDAVAEGREVILDNSIFELGTAFDAERYAYWIEKLKPTWYIVPDVLEDEQGTLDSFWKFKAKYAGKLPGKVIAVAQGRNIWSMLRCFERLHDDPYVDMVALSFDLSFYETEADRIIQNNDLEVHPGWTNPKLNKWITGRAYLLDILLPMYGTKRFYKPIHLLGCALPIEGKGYTDLHQQIIYSTDTSNPVIAGYENVRYSQIGLVDKSKTKLFTIINEPVNDEQWEDIYYNIMSFKHIWRDHL